MKNFTVLTIILSFFIGSNAYAASQVTGNEVTIANTIQKAAMKDKWTPYIPSVQAAAETLYFKKRIRNKDYYTYRYQNRHQNKHMTVYVKVDYTNNNVNVEFVDKVSMNPGRLGIGNKVDKVLHELKDAINTELSAKYNS